ncbi:MAG: hypothetical protein WEB30_13980 [Cyclobacteriaceae bacterium]
MTTRVHENLLKGIFFLILFTILLLQSLITSAQPGQRDSQKTYKGFFASFGSQSQTVSSSIVKIDGTNLLQTGGQLGLVYGNNIVRAKLGLLGYYASSGNTAGTTDLYVSSLSVNFYPLSWISKKSLMIEPYLTGGVDYDQYKFYGFYLNQEPGTINYSQAEAPFLGKVKQVNATAGLGIEVKLKDRFDFVHLFSEFRYGRDLSTKTKNSAFSATTPGNQTHILIGISFGSRN